jgi:Hemerythrin HHE cation binding domain
MDALELLTKDHAKVKGLLEELEGTDDSDTGERERLYRRVRKEMETHEAIEEEIFYPALKSHPKAKDIVLEGYEEHHVVDEIMGELEATDVTDETWGAKFKVMKENIEHHIEEEEGEMFKQARQVFDTDELEELGARMQELKQLGQQVLSQ